MDKIKEGNKLIAEFVDRYQGDDIDKSEDPIVVSEKWDWAGSIKQTIRPFTYADLKYHSSWDWLMPVVEKIEGLDYGFKMCRKVVEVYIDSTKEVILKTKEANRLASLYAAVIQFLTYYNQLNKTP